MTTPTTDWEEEFAKFGMHQVDGHAVAGWTEIKKEIKDFIRNLLTQQKEEIRGMVRDLTVPECKPVPNSEYHIGFNDARYAYAEEKLELLAALDTTETAN